MKSTIPKNLGHYVQASSTHSTIRIASIRLCLVLAVMYSRSFPMSAETMISVVQSAQTETKTQGATVTHGSMPKTQLGLRMGSNNRASADGRHRVAVGKSAQLYKMFYPPSAAIRWVNIGEWELVYYFNGRFEINGWPSSPNSLVAMMIAVDVAPTLANYSPIHH